MSLLRQFMASDNPAAQLIKGIVGTVTGLATTAGPTIEQIDAWVTLIGKTAGAACSVAMFIGMVVGWWRGRKRKQEQD